MNNLMRTLVDQLFFSESPRWYGDKLWFSDFYGKEVQCVDLSGGRKTIVKVPQQPSGIGWLPDGTLLVVSMIDQKLMELRDGRLKIYADLQPYIEGYANDMVVTSSGVAYVGSFGDLDNQRNACLVRIGTDKSVSVVAEDVNFPNGMVLLDKERTLVLAETFSNRLTAFDVDSDGGLSNRRVWADLGDYMPDGICADQQGSIWVAAPFSRSVIRVVEGGHVSSKVALSRDAFACAIGGHDGQSLFVCTASHYLEDECLKLRDSRIEQIMLSG